MRRCSSVCGGVGLGQVGVKGRGAAGLRGRVAALPPTSRAAPCCACPQIMSATSNALNTVSQSPPTPMTSSFSRTRRQLQASAAGDGRRRGCSASGLRVPAALLLSAPHALTFAECACVCPWCCAHCAHASVLAAGSCPCVLSYLNAVQGHALGRGVDLQAPAAPALTRRSRRAWAWACPTLTPSAQRRPCQRSSSCSAAAGACDPPPHPAPPHPTHAPRKLRCAPCMHPVLQTAHPTLRWHAVPQVPASAAPSARANGRTVDGLGSHNLALAPSHVYSYLPASFEQHP